jgi:hypothetical protein
MIESEIQSHHDEPPELMIFLSQSAVVGAFMGFVTLAYSMILHSASGYNFFLMLCLLPSLLSGMFFGAFEGSLIWVCARIAGGRLHFVLRGCIGIGIHVTLISFIWLVHPHVSPPLRDDMETLNYIYGIWFYIGYGLILGLVTGSRFEPLYELFRGTTITPWRIVATGLTGTALRIVVIFAFMHSVLYLIWQEQRIEISHEQTIAVTAMIHFIAAGVIVFARMPSWLLLQLALIINLPVVVFITDVLTTEDAFMRMVSFIYLAIWFAFLVTRLSGKSKQNLVTT